MNRAPRNDKAAPGFEEVGHTADRALKINGRDLVELFTNAALGMNSLLLSAGPAGPADSSKPITLEAIDAESLLVAWLSELAFWAEAESLIFTRFEFHHLSPTRLGAVAAGSRVDAIEKHVKAVTFHDLKIAPAPGGLATTVVFDV